MEKCKRHPHRGAPYRCAKYDTYFCKECLKCKDPKLYCKHRTACAIHFMEKENNKGWLEGEAQTGDSRTDSTASTSEDECRANLTIPDGTDLP